MTVSTSRTLALPLAALASGALPLIASAALAATGSPAAAAILPLETAFEVALALGAVVATVGWSLVALGERRSEGPPGRLVELVLLAAGLAPALRLAALLSRVPDDAQARGLVALALVAGAHGVLLAGLARTRVRASTVGSLVALLVVGLPLASAFVHDATDDDLGLTRASAAGATLATLQGGPIPWGLALALALPGVALLAIFRRGDTTFGGATAGIPAPRPGAALALALAASFGVLASARAQEPAPALELVEARPLLGPRVRAGELAPVRVKVRAGASGFSGEVGARSGGVLVAARVDLGPLVAHELALPAVADASGTPQLEARARDGTAFPLAPREPAASIPAWSGLLGEVDDARSALAAALVRGRRTWRAPLDRRDLDLAGLGGAALDVLVVPGSLARDDDARARLAAFASLGGSLVLDDEPHPDDLLARFEGAAPLVSSGGALARPLGAGEVVARAPGATTAAVASRLVPRLALRARPDPTTIALALAELAEPTASARTAGHAALVATLAFCALALVLVTGRSAGDVPRALAFACASLALTAALPWLVLGGARAPVLLSASSVLELPRGGTTAGAIEVLRLAAPRRTLADVTFEPDAPLVPVFATEALAARARDEVLVADAASSIDEAPVRWRAPLAPGEGRALVRRTIRRLPGTVTIEDDRATNGLPWRIEGAVLVGRDAVTLLPDLKPGATIDLHGTTLPFHAYLARLAAAPGDEGRSRLALLRSAVARSSNERRIAGFVDAPLARRARRGVLEESRGPVLVLVRDTPN